jgi:DNA-directed RNA polymerase specialized sigma24 family protein
MINEPKTLTDFARIERDKIIWQLKTEGKSVRDICKIMNLALQTVQSAINRKRATMKNEAKTCA